MSRSAIPRGSARRDSSRPPPSSPSSSPSATAPATGPTPSPARAIGTSHRAMRGEVQVKGTPIAYESALERDLLITLDFIPTAREVRGQPVTITYPDPATGRQRRYTPDVAVRFDPPIDPRYPAGMIVEVKYRDELFASWPTLKPKFKAARAYAAAHGARFAILTERENAVGLCLTMAMLPKDAYLSRLGVPGSWPVWGTMGKLLCDNAKEFRGKMLSRACREWGINPEFRPVKLPHYGGHIERLMGTVANEIRTLDGATFSNPKERGSYDSEGRATQTLEEIERHLVDFFVTGYHERFHHGIDGSPKERWRLGIQGDGTKPGTGLPALIADTQKLRLDFTPTEERTIQEYGVALDHVHY